MGARNGPFLNQERPTRENIMELHYGSRIKHKRSEHHYFVRAVAPDASVILARTIHPLNEPCRVSDLSIVNTDELDACFELVKS